MAMHIKITCHRDELKQHIPDEPVLYLVIICDPILVRDNNGIPSHYEPGSLVTIEYETVEAEDGQ
jgi:hypothetical protein